LSGRPANFHVFFGFATSVPHLGHLPIYFFPPYDLFDVFIIIT
jgi:hypothetical protein